MPERSAGLLLYRRGDDGAPEVFLVHPGGPFWQKKDAGAWSIPKGEIDPAEDALDAARREVAEETGFRPDGPFTALGEIRQKGGKVVTAWAVEADVDPAAIASNTTQIEWPPRTGRRLEIPEIDRAAYFDLARAREKINVAQAAFLDRLQDALGEKTPQADDA